MNTFAYAAALLAKSQTAFKLANAAGVEIPAELSTVVSGLQKVCDAAQGFEVPNSSQSILSDVERLLTESLTKSSDPSYSVAINDAITLVKNKDGFSVSYHTPTTPAQTSTAAEIAGYTHEA